MKNRKWDQNIWVADMKKTNDVFNKKNSVDLNTGIKKFIKWYKNNYKIYEKIRNRG